MINLKYKKRQLQKIAKNYSIKFIVLYGSRARSESNEASDVDLAVMVDTSILIDRHYQLSLFADIQKIFMFSSEIDIVFLNTATPLLKYQVAMEGQMLFEAQTDLFSDFAIRVMKEYEDLRHFDMYENEVINDYLKEIE